MVTTVRPKASDTPTRPMPTSGNFAASTALPQPPKTSQNVPNNSATARFAMGMDVSPVGVFLEAESCRVVEPRKRGNWTYVGSLAVGLAGFLRGRVDFRDQIVDGLLGADVGQVVGRDDGHRHQSAAFDSEGVGAPGGRLAYLDPHGPLVLDTRSPDGSWARRAVVQVVRVQHRVDAQARIAAPGVAARELELRDFGRWIVQTPARGKPVRAAAHGDDEEDPGGGGFHE